jgi:membrane associated rhomboid family serine protease
MRNDKKISSTLQAVLAVILVGVSSICHTTSLTTTRTNVGTISSNSGIVAATAMTHASFSSLFHIDKKKKKNVVTNSARIGTFLGLFVFADATILSSTTSVGISTCSDAGGNFSTRARRRISSSSTSSTANASDSSATSASVSDCTNHFVMSGRVSAAHHRHQVDRTPPLSAHLPPLLGLPCRSTCDLLRFIANSRSRRRALQSTTSTTTCISSAGFETDPFATNDHVIGATDTCSTTISTSTTTRNTFSSKRSSPSWSPPFLLYSRNNHHKDEKYNSNNYYYEDGEDEWDKLEKIKKDLEPKLGGYRPWSIDTSYGRRPGQYSWTSKIVLLNIAIYGLQMINPNITRMFAKRSDMILNGRQLYRLVTPIFLHGSISHLMLNSFSLNNIGPEVERIFGGGRFLATYLVGGIAGNLASAYYTPNPSLGASGAVFGLMGAYYTFLSRNENLFGSLGQEMMGRVGSTLGMNVLFGMLSPSIDNWAHIGGGIGGVAMATTFGPKLYLMMLPSGGRIIVDKPAVRLPPVIESIPGKISKRFRRVKRRMQVQRYQSELPAKPWRRNKFGQQYQHWRKKRGRRIPNGKHNGKTNKNSSWNSIMPRVTPPRAKVDEFLRRPLYGED